MVFGVQIVLTILFSLVFLPMRFDPSFSILGGGGYDPDGNLSTCIWGLCLGAIERSWSHLTPGIFGSAIRPVIFEKYGWQVEKCQILHFWSSLALHWNHEWFFWTPRVIVSHLWVRECVWSTQIHDFVRLGGEKWKKHIYLPLSLRTSLPKHKNSKTKKPGWDTLSVYACCI